MKRIVAAIGLLLLIALGLAYMDSHYQLEKSMASSAQLREEVAGLRAEVDELRGQVKALDESSIQGVVRQANGAIIDGWQTLMNSIEDELESAREALKEQEGDISEPAPQEQKQSEQQARPDTRPQTPKAPEGIEHI